MSEAHLRGEGYTPLRIAVLLDQVAIVEARDAAGEPARGLGLRRTCDVDVEGDGKIERHTSIDDFGEVGDGVFAMVPPDPSSDLVLRFVDAADLAFRSSWRRPLTLPLGAPDMEAPVTEGRFVAMLNGVCNANVSLDQDKGFVSGVFGFTRLLSVPELQSERDFADAWARSTRVSADFDQAATAELFGALEAGALYDARGLTRPEAPMLEKLWGLLPERLDDGAMSDAVGEDRSQLLGSPRGEEAIGILGQAWQSWLDEHAEHVDMEGIWPILEDLGILSVHGRTP